MLTWLTTNSESLNVLANWSMVVIWIIYLQVFLRSFRRQALPKIVINQAAGTSLDAACFVSNMSSEAIYIESIVVEIEIEDEKLACTVTDLELIAEEDKRPDPKQRTFQGPLPSSEYTSLGTFQSLIESVGRRTARRIERFQETAEMISITVTIIADYASETLLVGAKRRFTARAEDDWRLTPDAPCTDQIRSPRKRKQLSAASIS
jgi:hypothetical protein